MRTSALFFVASTLLTADASSRIPSVPAAGIERQERDALQKLEVRHLLHRRAGGSPHTTPLNGADRDQLRLLEREELEQRRAGDLSLSNADLRTVLLVLGILVLLVILL